MLIGAARCGEADQKENRGAAVLLVVGYCELLLLAVVWLWRKKKEPSWGGCAEQEGAAELLRCFPLQKQSRTGEAERRERGGDGGKRIVRESDSPERQNNGDGSSGCGCCLL